MIKKSEEIAKSTVPHDLVLGLLEAPPHFPLLFNIMIVMHIGPWCIMMDEEYDGGYMSINNKRWKCL